MAILKEIHRNFDLAVPYKLLNYLIYGGMQANEVFHERKKLRNLCFNMNRPQELRVI